MDVRNFVVFEADTPDDGVPVENGEPIPAGRAIAETLRDALCTSDRAGSVVAQYSFYGWEFRAGPYWCLLQYADPWLLIVEDRSRIVERWFNRRRTATAFRAFLDQLRDFLDAEPRFSRIRCFTKREYDDHTRVSSEGEK